MSGMNSGAMFTVAVVVVIALVGGLLIERGGGVASQNLMSTYVDQANGLKLQLGVNSSEIGPGQSLQVSISEVNRLGTLNNVSTANLWQAVGLSLSSCGRGPLPFGMAIYRGNVDASNVTSAKPLSLFPPVACPDFVRLITGYLFQPSNSMATILPSFGNQSPTNVSSTLTLTGEYMGAQEVAFSPGLYTLVAGDEWGSILFLNFTVAA